MVKQTKNAASLVLSAEKAKMRRAFALRMILTIVVVFVLWWFISPFYIALTKSFVVSLVNAFGYYTNASPKLTDALMSPAIPFIILMIGTWGPGLFMKDGKINTKTILWSLGVLVLLVLLSMLGQFFQVYMGLSGESPFWMVSFTSFLIATGPVLVPIVAWLALSYGKLREIFLS